MINDYFKLVTFSHTVFALPFALLGYTLAVLRIDTLFDPFILVYVILCMVFARNAAMAYNRFLDRDIDRLNPRTNQREIPSGKIKSKSALMFVIFNSIVFIAVTFLINPTVFKLSPIALLIVLGYSHTKRFTNFSHFVLGLGLSLAPIGAYLAIVGNIDFMIVLYSVSVLLWVSGFDIIYSLQDEEFDRKFSLQSMPVKLGKENSLLLSKLLHFLCACMLASATYSTFHFYPSAGLLSVFALVFFIAMLIYQHTLVSPQDLGRVNKAFFTTNGIASLVFCGVLIIDLVIV